ncbi:MAG: hypothetical protein JWN99_61, partial [Ilumatobacteraceae bacterium]|nr:hypothetical protein [Ilumatobacteraceae bacterium]
PSTHVCDTDDGESAMGPSPLEVLLAFVAAGSTTFVARFSAQQGIPVHRIDITAQATVEASPQGVPVIRSIRKVLSVGGDLTGQQFRDVQFFSASSAGSETARRGAGIEDELVVLPPARGTTAGDLLLDIGQLSTTGSRLVPA